MNSSSSGVFNQTDVIQQLTQMAKAIERGEYKPEMLANLTSRSDDLGQLARVFDSVAREMQARNESFQLLNTVIPIGVKLSAERDFNRLLEAILVEAQKITNADAGTLYLVTEENTLRFVIVRNSSLNINMGGTSGKPITFSPLPLYNTNGKPNHNNIATYVALTRQRIKIPDAYEAEGFDFSGTKAFDQRTNYRSKSFFTIPLLGENQQVIGVIQLINAKDPETNGIVAFRDDDVIEALILLASAALSGYIREEQLRQEIAKLRIEIDQNRRERQVAEITDTEYFRVLQGKARQLREKKDKK